MPTQPGSHSREDSLPSVPDSDFGGSISRNRRSLVALAQKTSTALATLSGTTLRSSPSYGTLSRKLPTPPSEQLTDSLRPTSPALDNPNSLKRRLTLQRIPTLSPNPSLDPPKMHQTSSRLLRMTEDERPFTKVGFLFFCVLFLFPNSKPKGNQGADMRRISWTCSPR